MPLLAYLFMDVVVPQRTLDAGAHVVARSGTPGAELQPGARSANDYRWDRRQGRDSTRRRGKVAARAGFAFMFVCTRRRYMARMQDCKCSGSGVRAHGLMSVLR
jgi:hypothetical protein